MNAAADETADRDRAAGDYDDQRRDQRADAEVDARADDFDCCTPTANRPTT